MMMEIWVVTWCCSCIDDDSDQDNHDDDDDDQDDEDGDDYDQDDDDGNYMT
jgi:hypothetical protein